MTSDCEAWGSGVLAQPVDALSSLAYVVVGAIVMWLAVRGRWTRWFVPLGVVVALEGVGSVAFHGEGGDLAQVLHDAPLLGLVGFLAGWHLARIRPDAGEDRLGRAAVGGLVLGSALGVVGAYTGLTAVLSGLGVALVVLGEVVARRRGAPGIWTVGPLVLVAVGVLAWWTGAPGGALCDPDSLLQPHALWHVVSALVVLVWADRAAAVLDERGSTRVLRAVADRAIASVARVLTFAFYRSVDVVGRDRIPWGRPMLVVANHANGFVDPVLVAAALRRLPRFMAKAALWKMVVARPFLALAGVLPVYRRSDGDDVSGNVSVFAACHEVHARGGIVAIFPEGTTGDRGGLDRVRTGAARIALGSLPVAPDLVIVPVGLAFEDRSETRGRALVEFGEPLVPTVPAAGSTADAALDHAEVRLLTEEIRESLESVSPDYESVDERDLLRAAARVGSGPSDPHRVRRFGESELLARRLASAPDDDRARVVAAYEDYATRLQLLGLRDRQLQPRSTSWARLVASAAVVAALGSVVAVAVLVHLPALLLVWASTAAVRSTATKGTVRLLVGLVAGLATWVIFGVVVADGWSAVVAGLLIALEGAVALVLLPPLLRWADDLWGRLRMRDRAGLLPPVEEARRSVADAVAVALGDDVESR